MSQDGVAIHRALDVLSGRVSHRIGQHRVALLGLLLAACGGDSGSVVREAASALEVAEVSGSISLLTYNVAGLPEVFSSSDPEANMPQIGPLLAGYELVHVQEDFNYHGALYAGDVHPYRSSTSGGVPFGDGLNTLSYRSFGDFARTTWDACNGTDCLTPKGFSYARQRLDEGVYVDFYNVHANAGTEDADLSARRSNLRQLLNSIEQNSRGNAVVVMGDSNARFTRSEDNVRDFLDHGFSDAWIERVRGGERPEADSDALLDCWGDNSAPNCETIDKIMYRSSRLLALWVDDYHVEDNVFVDSSGGPLSDHNAVYAQLSYAVAGDLRASDLVGGPHGTMFNDLAALPDYPAPQRVSLRAGSRLDQIAIEFADGTRLVHGGSGGTEKSLSLDSGEALISIELCIGQKDDHTRVFYAALSTDYGRSLSGGKRTKQCTRFDAPEGFQIAGFFGRSGAEIDKLGVIYALR